MFENLGITHRMHVKYHPGNVVSAALHYQVDGYANPDEIRLLANYRDEAFDPYPGTTFFAWTEYLIASEFAAHFFNR